MDLHSGDLVVGEGIDEPKALGNGIEANAIDVVFQGPLFLPSPCSVGILSRRFLTRIWRNEWRLGRRDDV